MATVTIRPNGAGYYTNIGSQTPSSGAHWEKVDEAVADDADYVEPTSLNLVKDSYSLENPASGGTINSVTVYLRHRSFTAGHAYALLRLASVDTLGAQLGGASSFTTVASVVGRPGGGSWSWSDINALEAGMQVKGTGAFYQQVSQVYVVVDYDLIVDVSVALSHVETLSQSAQATSYGAVAAQVMPAVQESANVPQSNGTTEVVAYGAIAASSATNALADIVLNGNLTLITNGKRNYYSGVVLEQNVGLEGLAFANSFAEPGVFDIITPLTPGANADADASLILLPQLGIEFSRALDVQRAISLQQTAMLSGSAAAECYAQQLIIISPALAYLGSKATPVLRIEITDLSGTLHTINTARSLEVAFVLSSAADSFDFELLNDDGEYSYIEAGCEAVIYMGVGYVTKRITGVILNVKHTLDDALSKGIIVVDGLDWGWRMSHIYFSGRYFDMEVSDIIKAILADVDFTTSSTYRELAQLSSDYAHIETTLHTVDTATFVWKSLASAIDELAKWVGYEWYVDTDKKLHFFDPALTAVSETIVDAQIEGSPTVTDVSGIINRAIVVGGYKQNADITGETHTTTTTVTDASTNNQSFVPTHQLLSSVLVWTKQIVGSQSTLAVSIQCDSSGSPDGKNIANAYKLIDPAYIVDDDYSEFRFSQHVTLTVGDTYWLLIAASTSDGQDIGVDSSGNVDFVSRYPVRITGMADDKTSRGEYGMLSAVPYRDELIEDSDIANQKALEMLMTETKKSATLVLRGWTVTAGDNVQLTLSQSGIAINKTMTIVRSTLSMGHVFIFNELELEEL